MLLNYVSQFWQAQNFFPEAITFGTNAFIERHGVPDVLSFHLAKRYLGWDKHCSAFTITEKLSRKLNRLRTQIYGFNHFQAIGGN